MTKTEEEIKEGIDGEVYFLPDGVAEIVAWYNDVELGTIQVDIADIGEWHDPDSSLYGVSSEAVVECIYHHYRSVLHAMP